MIGSFDGLYMLDFNIVSQLITKIKKKRALSLLLFAATRVSARSHAEEHQVSSPEVSLPSFTCAMSRRFLLCGANTAFIFFP